MEKRGSPFVDLLVTLSLQIFILAGSAQAQNVSFITHRDYGVGDAPASVAVGDFNRDGIQDLAVANTDSSNVSVLLGNGDGTFQAAVNFDVGLDNFPFSVAVGDFNGDGIQDLAVANNDLGTGNVSVLLGNGDGTFQPAVEFSAGVFANSVAVGDFNGDGVQDLAVASGDFVWVLLGDGGGTFQVAVNFGAGSVPVSVAVGDFNGDGIQDLTVANRGDFIKPGNVSVLLGNGDGTFQAAVNFDAGDEPVSVGVGDFNGDGVQDLAVAGFFDRVSVLLGNGDGTFQAAVNFDVGLEPVSVAVGDFNGDGLQDLAVANNFEDIINGSNVSVLINNTQ